MERDEPPPPEEFWQEESRHQRRLMHRTVWRWAAIFALLFAFVLFAFWWAGSAVHFSTTRVDESTPATWRVFGEIRNSRTGQPVPWATVEDDPAGRPPHYQTSANHEGAYELMTIAEPHTVRVTALGYKAASVRVGRVWYLWMPRGEERLDVGLEPE